MAGFGSLIVKINALQDLVERGINSDSTLQLQDASDTLSALAIDLRDGESAASASNQNGAHHVASNRGLAGSTQLSVTLVALLNIARKLSDGALGIDVQAGCSLTGQCARVAANLVVDNGRSILARCAS